MKTALFVSKIFWGVLALIFVISVLIRSQQPTVRFCDELENQKYEYCQK